MNCMTTQNGIINSSMDGEVMTCLENVFNRWPSIARIVDSSLALKRIPETGKNNPQQV